MNNTPQIFMQNSFENVQIEDMVDLIEQSKWISELHLLDINSPEGVQEFESIPTEWLTFLNNHSSDTLYEICSNQILYQEFSNEMPLSLVSFLKKLETSALNRHAPSTYFNQEFILSSSTFTEDDCRKAGMSRKKLHEVERLSRLVRYLMDKYQIDQVIDVGSGIGYLTHELGQYVPVTGIEANHALTVASNKRTQKRNQHLNNNTDIKLVHGFVTESNLLSLTGPVSNALLTGLHSCGDLSISMIQQFKQHSGFRVILSLGCCYQHVTFPRSQKLKQLSLSVKALKLACHSFVNFDKDRMYSLWNSQSNRNVKGSGQLSYDVIQKRVAFLTMLKQALSFCLESIILLDRFFLIQEAGYQAFLFPLFDYQVSTRNMAIVGIK